MNTPAEMIEVIEADRNGKGIECRENGETKWTDITGLKPLFNFQHFTFRIKQEREDPREWWVTCDQISTDGIPINPRFFHDRQETHKKQIRVREIE